MSLNKKIDAWINSEGHLAGYGIYRIILGFMLWRHTWLFLENRLRMGPYDNRFYLPYFDWYPEPSDFIYISVLVTILFCGALLILGYRVRFASVVAFSFLTYHFFINQLWYRHNRYFFILLLLLLIVGPGNQVFTLATRSTSQRLGKIWSYALVRLQMSFTYLASAYAKTLDPDWSSGNVLTKRLTITDDGRNRYGDDLTLDTTSWFLQVISLKTLGEILTFLALLQEYFLAVCLWVPATRKLAIWVGVIFHGSIEVGAHVLVFSYAVLATYFLVVQPTVYDRILYFNPGNKRHRFMANLISYLDWLDKIRIIEAGVERIVVIDKDTKAYKGTMALAVAGSCLVLPFILAYPITWLKHMGIGRAVSPDKEEEREWKAPSLSSASIFTILTVLIIAYQLLVLAVATDIIDLNLRDLRFVDLVLVFVIFFFVTRYYKEESGGLKAT